VPLGATTVSTNQILDTKRRRARSGGSLFSRVGAGLRMLSSHDMT